jgi:YVTN family beta-propeller protein
VAVSFNNGGAGTSTEVNASGDTNAGNFPLGHGPVHAMVSTGAVRAYVVNKNDDTISFYAANVAGSAVGTVTLPAGAAPVFVHSTEGQFVYVADSGTNDVAMVDQAQGAATGFIPVGVRPVALAENPGATRLYAVNQGDGTVTAIDVATKTQITTIPVGTSPVWAVMKSDGSTLYVVNQGSSSVSVIDVASNTVTATVPVGASPRFAAYDPHLSRLYVANTGSNTVSIFDASLGLTLLATATVGAGPASITALPDGTRAYVANSGCSDAVNLANCNGNTVSVIDATSLQQRSLISVGSTPVSIDSTTESNKVVVANRDSNSVSTIRTLDDTVVTNVPTASPQPVFVVVNK